MNWISTATFLMMMKLFSANNRSKSASRYCHSASQVCSSHYVWTSRDRSILCHREWKFLALRRFPVSRQVGGSINLFWYVVLTSCCEHIIMLYRIPPRSKWHDRIHHLLELVLGTGVNWTTYFIIKKVSSPCSFCQLERASLRRKGSGIFFLDSAIPICSGSWL